MIWMYLLSSMAALMVAIGFGRFAYTPMIPIMMEQAGLSIAYAGYLASINYVGYTIGALTPLFWKGDHARVPALRLGLLLTVFACGLMSVNIAQSQQIFLWSFARFLNGVGSALILVNTASLTLQKLAEQDRLKLMGVLFSGVGIGSLLITLVINYLEINKFNWQLDWQVIAALSLIFALPALAVWKAESGHFQASDTQKHSFSVVNIPAVWWLVIAYFGQGFSYIIVMTFLPVITQGMGGLAEKSWLILTFSAIPSTVLWGYLSDRFGNLKCLKTAYVLQLFGFLSLEFIVQDTVGAIICAVLVGVTFMGIVNMVLAQARFIKPVVATMVMSLATGIYSVGQILGPGFAGYIAQTTGSFSIALSFAAFLLIFSLFALQRLDKSLQA